MGAEMDKLRERLRRAEEVCELASELNQRDLYGTGRSPHEIMDDMIGALIIWRNVRESEDI